MADTDSELRKQLQNIFSDNSVYDEDLVEDDLVNLITAHTEAAVRDASKYQTHIYKQQHPRLEPKEIWAICIAHKGKQIYGDIAESKIEAEAKLEAELERLNKGLERNTDE